MAKKGLRIYSFKVNNNENEKGIFNYVVATY